MLNRILMLVALSIAFSFIGQVVQKNWERIDNMAWDFDEVLLSISIFFLGIAIFGACFSWFLIIKSVGIDTSYRFAQYNWFLSNLGKYIPGKIWSISSRAYLHRFENHSVKLVVSASLLEAIFSYAITIFVVLCLIIALDKRDINLLPLIAMFLFCCLFMSSRFFSKVVNLGLSLIKKGSLEIEIPIASRARVTMIYLLTSIVRGIAFSLFIKSLFPLSPNTFTLFWFSLEFSNLISLVVFFVPKGMGIRESILIVLLSATIGEPAALVVSIGSRLWFLFTELLITFVVTQLLKPEYFSTNVEKDKL